MPYSPGSRETLDALTEQYRVRVVAQLQDEHLKDPRAAGRGSIWLPFGSLSSHRDSQSSTTPTRDVHSATRDRKIHSKIHSRIHSGIPSGIPSRIPSRKLPQSTLKPRMLSYAPLHLACFTWMQLKSCRWKPVSSGLLWRESSAST